jgi:hypothetical protein
MAPRRYGPFAYSPIGDRPIALAEWRSRRGVDHSEYRIFSSRCNHHGPTADRIQYPSLGPARLWQSIRILDAALDFIANHQDAWFATGSEIVDAYLDQMRKPA